MTGSRNEDAQMTNSQRQPGSSATTTEPDALILQRWCDLREMLIGQLDMFETGGLRLHSGRADISSSAIVDLKASILEFDALIAREAGKTAR